LLLTTERARRIACAFRNLASTLEPWGKFARRLALADDERERGSLGDKKVDVVLVDDADKVADVMPVVSINTEVVVVVDVVLVVDDVASAAGFDVSVRQK
jgi:hypothetical protein